MSQFAASRHYSLAGEGKNSQHGPAIISPLKSKLVGCYLPHGVVLTVVKQCGKKLQTYVVHRKISRARV
jgi:hypothetical protein